MPIYFLCFILCFLRILVNDWISCCLWSFQNGFGRMRFDRLESSVCGLRSLHFLGTDLICFLNFLFSIVAQCFRSQPKIFWVYSFMSLCDFHFEFMIAVNWRFFCKKIWCLRFSSDIHHHFRTSLHLRFGKIQHFHRGGTVYVLHFALLLLLPINRIGIDCLLGTILPIFLSNFFEDDLKLLFLAIRRAKKFQVVIERLKITWVSSKFVLEVSKASKTF